MIQSLDSSACIVRYFFFFLRTNEDFRSVGILFTNLVPKFEIRMARAANCNSKSKCARMKTGVGLEEQAKGYFSGLLLLLYFVGVVFKTQKKRTHCAQLCNLLAFILHKCALHWCLHRISNFTTYILPRLQLGVEKCTGFLQNEFLGVRRRPCTRTIHVHPVLWCREFLGDPTVSWALPGLSSPRGFIKTRCKGGGSFWDPKHPPSGVFFF